MFQPLDVQESLLRYDEAINQRINHHINQNQVLSATKEAIENELNSSNVEKSMYQADIVTLQCEFEALKVAYNAVSSELKSNETKLLTVRNHINEELNEKIKKLESENSDNLSKLVALQHLAQDYPSINEKLSSLEIERLSMDSTIQQLKDEIEELKRLNDAMIAKMRNFHSNMNDREFLDTFEEVMRDEMTAMKLAYERKLKVIREELNMSTIRYQSEIQSLRNMNKTFSKAIGGNLS